MLRGIKATPAARLMPSALLLLILGVLLRPPGQGGDTAGWRPLDRRRALTRQVDSCRCLARPPEFTGLVTLDG